MLINNLVIIIILNVILIIYWYKKHTQLINIGSMFNLLSIIYFVIGIYIYNNIYNGIFDKELLIISNLAICAVIAFNLGYFSMYILRRTNIYVKKYTDVSIKIPDNKLIVLILIISIGIQLLLVLNIGPLNFIFMDRTERFHYFYQNIGLVYISNFIYIIYILYSINFIYYNNKKYKKLFYFTFIYILIWGLITISRNDLLIIFLTLLYISEKKGLVSTYKIIMYSISFLLLLLFFKGIMYMFILNNISQEGINFGEIVNWIRNSITIMHESNYSYEHFSYFITIKGIFTPLIDKMEPLSNWFMSEYYPIAYANGNKYGFSGLIEGYMMGGYHYTFIHFFITGLFVAYFSFGKTWLHMIISIMIILIMYKLFRSESYNFYRQIFWYTIYPILLIKLISFMGHKKS